MAWIVQMGREEADAMYARAVLAGGDDAVAIRRAVHRECRRVAKELGFFESAAKHECRVGGCGRVEWVLRRGRCGRCDMRARRGGWLDQDPRDDMRRFVESIRTKPAAQLALVRAGVLRPEWGRAASRALHAAKRGSR